MLRAVLAAAGFLFLASCTPTEPSAAEALEAGMARWQARGPSEYEIIVHRGPCECLPEMVVSVRVSVRDGAVESVRNQATGEAITMELFHAMTVEEMFTLIGSALAQNAYRIAVRYDPVLGYPRAIVIDYERDSVDDEIALAAEIAR